MTGVRPPIVYVDTSAVRAGRRAPLRTAMRELAAFVRAHVPRLLSYGFYLDAGGRRMTVVAVHPDSASLAFHLDAAGPQFGRFADLVELRGIEVYGRVSDAVLRRLRQKARMLGGETGTVTVHAFSAGFARRAIRATQAAGRRK